MDHVSVDEGTKIEASVNNSFGSCQQPQVGPNESSESMKLFLEESQGDLTQNNHNDINTESDSNTIPTVPKKNDVLSETFSDENAKQIDDNKLNTDMKLDTNFDADTQIEEIDKFIMNGNLSDITENGISEKQDDAENNMTTVKNTDTDQDKGSGTITTSTDKNQTDTSEETDLYPATSTDTFTSNPSASSLSTELSNNDLNNTLPIETTHLTSTNSSYNASISEANDLITKDTSAKSNDVPETMNRKRKIEDETSDVIKIKRISDSIDNKDNMSTSIISFSGDCQENDSSSISLNIPETSLDTSNSRTLINGESVLMNSSNNCFSSANLTTKDDSDMASFSGNETPELHKRESLFLNNSEGLNIEGSSSPDQVPTFELITRFDESNDIVSLVINRTDRKYLDYNADWSQNSSPGSVTSTGVYQLSDHKRISTMSSSTTSSVYSTKAPENFVIPAVPLRKTDVHKQGIKGHKELFKQIKEIFKVACSDLSSDDFNSSNEKEDKSTMSDNCSMIKMKSLINEAVDNHYELINSPEMISEYVETVSNTNFSMTPKKEKVPTRVTSTTPSLNTTASEQSSEQDPRIMQRVLARWVDKKYYAGRVVDVKDNNKFTIRFDDDHTKTLLNDYIIFGEQNILPLHGQSIYVMLNNEEEYVPAIVTSILKESNRVKYIVQTDGGESGSVMASDIYLTEDQARSIKEIHTSVSKVESNSTPKKMNGQDVCLDNIIHGPRSRRQVTMKAITPKAGSSGLNKHKRTGGRGSKQRKFSESSDRSITEPPSPASTTECDEASSVKGPIEEVHGVEPEVQKTPKKIIGVLTGPFPVKGCGRLSGRRTSKVTGSLYDNSDPDTVNLLGPIPTSNKLFQKKCFLLTCTEDVSQKLKLARQEACEASGTDSEYSTDAENCTVPFMKERLRHQLEAGGGLVFSHFEEIPQNKYRTCILIAPRPCHTAKYIQCLAANIKAVLHTWVVDCCKSNKLLLEYDLPAGWSIERKCYVRYQIGKERYMRLSSNPFNDFLILLCSDNDNFLKFWGRVCKSAGASTKIIENEDLGTSVGSVIVTDSDCPLKVRKQAQNLDIPLVSTTWVVQSLIIGQVCNYDNSIKYAHNYVDTD